MVTPPTKTKTAVTGGEKNGGDGYHDDGGGGGGNHHHLPSTTSDKEEDEEEEEHPTTADSDVLPDEEDDTSSSSFPPHNAHPHPSHHQQHNTIGKREPFLAFVPKVAGWAGGLIRDETKIAKSAVLRFPSWSYDYMVHETYQYYRAHPRILFSEIISGFTVAIMQVPESIAFSFVAGVPPLSGLQATFWMALITGIFGGKPGMISGAAGALAVVVADLTSDDGPLNYLSPPERLNVLYMTMFTCGLFQIGMAWLRLAKVVRLIPETGLIGFMNGLAIIIFMAQLPAFQYCTAEPLFIECTLEQRQWLTFQNVNSRWVLILSLVHVFMCMAIMKFWPMVPKVGKVVPASLMGLLIGTLMEHTLFRMAFGVATRTVEETAPISGSLPQFHWPAMSLGTDDMNTTNTTTTLSTMLSFAVTLAIIGSVESVLTLQACNEITDTVPKISDSHQELFAQGLANAVCGLFQAMGGDAMIGQSTINITNGARHRMSSSFSGIFMLLFIVALSPFINLLPVSTLTGVLFMVVLSTFQWKTFVILRYGRLSDSIAIVLVTCIAVIYNLAIAIGIGIVFSALVHAWDSGSHVDADIVIKPNMMVNGVEQTVKYVHVRGAIFFSSTRKFVNFFHVGLDPSFVVMDLKDALIVDHSAVAAIQGICHRFEQAGKVVQLVNVATKSHGRLHRTGDHRALKRQTRTIMTHYDHDHDHDHDTIILEKAVQPQQQEEQVEIKVKGDHDAVDLEQQKQQQEQQQPQERNETVVGTEEAPIHPSHQHPHPTQHHHHHHMIDEYQVGETLSHLPMFQFPAIDLDDEVEVLLLTHQQAVGDKILDIHEKDE